MLSFIGTDTLGSVLPHTLDIKHGLLFTEGGVSLQLHRNDAALSGCVFTVGHCAIPPYSEAVLHCWWPVDAVQWIAGGFDRFLREHRPGGGPDTGGPIGMEGASAGFKLWTGDRNGGAFF